MVEETMWEMNPHTKAKHAILDRYLKAWLPILFSRNPKLIYIDGFAGPGKYKGGEDGSPIIAIKVARDHVLNTRFKDILFSFVEKRTDRYDELDKSIRALGELPKNIQIRLYNSDFNDFIVRLLDSLERHKRTLAPTLVFVDPFGYSDINLNQLARVLQCDKCELLITYMVGFLDRFSFTDQQESIREILGITQEKLEELKNISSPDLREVAWLRLLKDRLVELSGVALYQVSFVMKSEQNSTLYYLVFFTKSVAGIKAMKEAMWNVGKTGEYSFSDYNFTQSTLLEYHKTLWIDEAADVLFSQYAGKLVVQNELEQWVLVNTPFIWRTSILKTLERKGKIEYRGSRKKAFAYPDERAKISFQPQ